jgi:flagellar basal-body rod modification protein FlgD
MSDTSSTSSIQSASGIQMDYMKLLVTQLQNQNPLEPMDNNQMASQLSSFSQLQQLENMNKNFSTALKNAERTYASSLLGKEVIFNTTTDDGQTVQAIGKVTQVGNNSDGSVALTVGNRTFGLDDIVSVSE